MSGCLGDDTRNGRKNSTAFDVGALQDCPWCGVVTRLEFIKGVYVCRNCHRPVYECCDGDHSPNQQDKDT